MAYYKLFYKFGQFEQFIPSTIHYITAMIVNNSHFEVFYVLKNNKGWSRIFSTLLSHACLSNKAFIVSRVSTANRSKEPLQVLFRTEHKTQSKDDIRTASDTFLILLRTDCCILLEQACWTIVNTGFMGMFYILYRFRQQQKMSIKYCNWYYI